MRTNSAASANARSASQPAQVRPKKGGKVGSASGGNGRFPVEPNTRQPADALGPRANRTIALILEASREVFLNRGYAGTTIDEITKAAGVSRASFYTYYPSKRDVLLAVGARSASEGLKLVKTVSSLEPSLDALMAWVGTYLELMDQHGAFAFAWTQAAREDDEIRLAGMHTHLLMCRVFGEALAALGDAPVSDPTTLGLAAFSAMERGWDYCRLYEGSVARSDVEAQIARMLWGSIRPVTAAIRPSRSSR
jgi:AcrR family transcriptional regulator